MNVPLIFTVCLGTNFVLYIILSSKDRLLVLLGVIQGAALCYSSYANHKSSRKVRCAIYFNPDLLVSIKSNANTCIFPRADGCRREINGEDSRAFGKCRATLQEHRNDWGKLHAHLCHMVELKLCKTCHEREGIEGCVIACAEKWLIEVSNELHVPTAQALGKVQPLSPQAEGDAPANAEPDETHPDGFILHLPGAFGGSDDSEPSQSLVNRTCLSSTGNQRLSSAETQPLSNALNVSPRSKLELSSPDFQSSLPQATEPGLARPSESDMPRPMPRSRSRRQSEVNPGWCLVPYKKTETLHKRIRMPLQQKEIDSGTIYILHREDDDEYYKVGYSERNAQGRLKEHLRCDENWKIFWTTKEDVKHAKRVEKLIHLECEHRNMRHQENFCKRGGSSCSHKHREIIKAPYEEVKKCVEYWVAWMTDHDPYTVVDSEGLGFKRRSSKGSSEPKTIHRLTNEYNDKMIHELTHKFCLMSTAESWVPSVAEQKRSRRRKSVPANITPIRPTSLEDTRQTQSAGQMPTATSSLDARKDEQLRSTSPTPIRTTKVRRPSRLFHTETNTRNDNSPQSHSQGETEMTQAEPEDSSDTPEEKRCSHVSSTNMSYDLSMTADF